MNSSIRVHHLYSYTYRNQRPRKLPFHQHPFWQLEIIREGSVTFFDDSGKRTIRSGKSLLIPGGCRHSFAYPERQVRWTTCKFEVSAVDNPGESLVLPEEPLAGAIIKALTACVDQHSVNRATTVFNNLTVALLELLSEQLRPDENPENPFLSRIEAEINGPWGSVFSVRRLAARLGYDPGYLSVKFRQATGHTLKEHIDHLRAARAVEFLEYSSLTVSEIAEVLEFPEVYSFSRFFKRCMGVSPLAWRKHRRPGPRS